MIYDQVYQQQLNALQNGLPIPNVPIAQPQQVQSPNAGVVNQGAGLAGKGLGMYAGGKLGGGIKGLLGGNTLQLTASPALPSGIGASSGVATPTLVGAKTVGGGTSGLGALGGAGATAGLGAMAALTGAGLYNYGGRNILSGSGDTGDYVDLALQANPLTMSLNPILDVFGVGSVGDMIGSGKSKEQNAREGFRGKLAELGLLESLGDKAYNVNFEGQAPYLMGFNGSFKEQDNSIKDLAKVLSRDAEGMKDRQTWDIDYTSDLDFMTNLASEGLGGLLMGGDMNDQQKQVFRELTNASLADTDREFNQDNWSNTIGDMRSLYEKAGITDAEIANQRLNELIGQGLEQQQQDQLRQGIGLVFGDNSFNLAQDLNAGRWNGVEQDINTRPAELSLEQLAGVLR